MFSSFHPIFAAAVVGTALALLALASACFVRSTSLKAGLVAAAFILLLPAAYAFVGLNPWLIDSRFRTYRNFYKDIEIGMTREQVLAAMQRSYPTDGQRLQPTVMQEFDRIGFFMNPETAREPNCEGILLTLQNGRVVKKEYLPD